MEQAVRLSPFMDRDPLLQTVELLLGVEGICESPLSKEAVSYNDDHGRM